MQDRRRREVGIRRRPDATVGLDRDVEVLADRPEPVVLGIVQGADVLVRVGRHRLDEHAAPQAVLLDPPDVVDGVVDVVHEDLADAGAPLGEPVAEVDQPAVVRADARQPVLVVLGLRRRREQDEAGEERGHGVREDHLTDHTVGVLLAVAHLVVPVAQPTVRARREVLVRVGVLGAPRVEVVEVLLLEELAVLRVAPTGVAVGRDDRVAVLVRRAHCHGSSPIDRTRTKLH